MEVDRNAMARDNRQISIQMELRANEALARGDLTAVQAHMLLYILRDPEQGASLTDIHRAFGYSMASLSGLVKRLREKGYVRVERCERDDRRKLLYPTEKGLAARAALEGALERLNARLYDCFSPEELAELDRMQKKMLHNLSACRAENCKEVTQG